MQRVAIVEGVQGECNSAGELQQCRRVNALLLELVFLGASELGRAAAQRGYYGRMSGGGHAILIHEHARRRETAASWHL